MAAVDVHRAKLFGRCERTTGMEPFDRLVEQVMSQPPYLQRKALTPNDFPSLQAVEDRLLGFRSYYQSIAHPFEWKFTRSDLDEVLAKIDRPAAQYQCVA